MCRPSLFNTNLPVTRGRWIAHADKKEKKKEKRRTNTTTRRDFGMSLIEAGDEGCTRGITIAAADDNNNKEEEDDVEIAEVDDAS